MEQHKSNSTQSPRRSYAGKKPKQPLSRDEARSIGKKRQSRVRKLRKKLALFALSFVVICVGVLLVLTVFFKINTINITGEKFYSNQQVVDCADIEVGDNLFSVNEKKLNEILTKELPYIKSVKLTRKLPDTLNIDVSLTREMAAMVNGEGYLLVDNTGKVLDKNAAMLRENVAFVSGVNVKKAQEGSLVELNNDDVTQDFITIISTLESSEFSGITEISLSPKNEFKLIYEDRITIKLGTMENLAVKLQRAKVAIDKENQSGLKTKGVLDLGTEPDVYFRPGEDVELTIPPEFVTDKDGNIAVDENGDFITTQSPAEAVTEETTQKEE